MRPGEISVQYYLERSEDWKEINASLPEQRETKDILSQLKCSSAWRYHNNQVTVFLESTGNRGKVALHGIPGTLSFNSFDVLLAALFSLHKGDGFREGIQEAAKRIHRG